MTFEEIANWTLLIAVWVILIAAVVGMTLAIRESYRDDR